jgi:hypothetical protein
LQSSSINGSGQVRQRFKGTVTGLAGYPAVPSKPVHLPETGLGDAKTLGPFCFGRLWLSLDQFRSGELCGFLSAPPEPVLQPTNAVIVEMATRSLAWEKIVGP